MWFDSSSIANLAKNALKEGEKTKNSQFIAWLIFNFFIAQNNSTKTHRQCIGYQRGR